MATATITLRTVISSTEDIAEPSGVGKKRRTTEQDFTHTCTTANYTTNLTAISSEIYSYIAGLSGTVSFIQGTVRIPNITAVATPFGYSSDVDEFVAGGDSNEADPLEAEAFRTSFTLGAGDYSSAATLKTALQTAVAACIALTPSYS